MGVIGATAFSAILEFVPTTPPTSMQQLLMKAPMFAPREHFKIVLGVVQSVVVPVMDMLLWRQWTIHHASGNYPVFIFPAFRGHLHNPILGTVGTIEDAARSDRQFVVQRSVTLAVLSILSIRLESANLVVVSFLRQAASTLAQVHFCHAATYQLQMEVSNCRARRSLCAA